MTLAAIIALGVLVIGFVLWLLHAATSGTSRRILCDDEIRHDERDPDVFLPPFDKGRR